MSMSSDTRKIELPDYYNNTDSHISSDVMYFFIPIFHQNYTSFGIVWRKSESYIKLTQKIESTK